MKIRQANKNDLKEIVKIEKICFPKAEAASEKDIYERFEVFGENFLVAEKDNKIIGFINGCTTDEPNLPDELYSNAKLHKPNGDYQTLFGLDVLPEYRRQGVAGKLLRSLIDLAKKRGKEGMVLTCKDHLIPFYESNGIEFQGVSKSCHGGAKWNDMLLIFDK